jgi:DeoR/GlpR family transcriptional regulator of sugar metabolism
MPEEQLKKLSLNPRQMKVVLYVKDKGKITNKEYQEINSVAKSTATRDLAELVDTYKVFLNSGFGAGSIYELIGFKVIGSQLAQLIHVAHEKREKNNADFEKIAQNYWIHELWIN